MRNPAWTIASVALAANASACASGGVATGARQGLVIADVARSEWTPPGEVTLDVRTGRYELKPAPPRSGSGGRGTGRIRRGTLAPDQLRGVRIAWDEAVSEGLEHPRCRTGGPPPRIIVSNAGTPRMVLADGGLTWSSPQNLGCWSEAGGRLHAVLETLFDAEARERD